jgi:hypothetical protein
MTILDLPHLLFFLLFVSSFGVLEAGYRIAKRTKVNADESHHEQIMGLRDSVLMLLSLLVGFTFAMAGSRFDQRRQLLIDEANAIGTTSLRARTLPEPQQSVVSQLLRQYTDARVDFSRTELDSSHMQAAIQRSKELQNGLWEQIEALSRQDRTPVLVSFVQSLNETIDLSEKRLAARENRIPAIIWTLIAVIALLASFTTGYGLSKRSWFPAVMMPLMFAAAVALIADLDSPTQGSIRTGQNSMLRLQQDLQK